MFKGFSQAEESSCVAIKEITLSQLTKQQIINLNNEMNILSQLKHESIVQLKSVYSAGDKRFLVSDISTLKVIEILICCLTDNGVFERGSIVKCDLQTRILSRE